MKRPKQANKPVAMVWLSPSVQTARSSGGSLGSSLQNDDVSTLAKIGAESHQGCFNLWYAIDFSMSKSSQPREHFGLAGTMRVDPHSTAYDHFNFWQDGTKESIASVSERTGFISTIYRMANHQDDDALDVTFDYICDLYADNLYSACEFIINEIDLSKLSPAIMIGILTITAHVQETRVARSWLYSRVKKHLTAIKGKSDAESLLDGLE